MNSTWLELFWNLLTTFYFHLIIFTPLAVYLTVGCGVCDSSADTEQFDTEPGDGKQQDESRDSSGFDINPAISPANIGDESKEPTGRFNWWNAKIGGLGGPGGSSTI